MNSLGREPQVSAQNFPEPRRGDRFRPRREPRPLFESTASVAAPRLEVLFVALILGLTPQAKHLSQLRGSVLQSPAKDQLYRPSRCKHRVFVR